MRWGIVLVIVAVAASAAPVSAAGESRSVWVWSDPAGLDVLAVASEGFNQIFLWSATGSSDEAATAILIDQAHAAGLEVYAVGGDPSWATAPGAWRGWAREVESGEWDGAVINVEPYLHPDWNTNRSGVASQYLRGVSTADKALSIPFFPTVPFWFDSIAHRKTTLLDAVAKRADGIVVLAYRDHAEGADGILDISAEEIAVGERRNITVVIAVETGQVQPEKVTFFEEGRTALDDELGIVWDSLAGSAAFGGTSVHHWDALRALSP